MGHVSTDPVSDEPDAPPEATVVDARERNRFEIMVGEELAGFAEYRRRPGLIAFTHTEIDPAFGGRGLGGALVSAALAETRAQKLGVLPFCPFVRRWIAEHPGELDLVPASRRAQFDLPGE